MAFFLALLFFSALCLVSFVQLLYLESLRLLTRDFKALEFFKQTLEERLGYETEQGAFVFSLIKHTLLVLTGAAFIGLSAAPGAGWQSWLEGFLLAWGVMLAASYVLPQILYRRTSGSWLAPLVPLLQFLALLFKPLTLLLSFLHSIFELGTPGPPGEKSEPGDEIEALITAGEEEGIIEKEDSRLIQNVVAFGDKRVHEVMTPRREIVAIEIDKTLEDLRRLAKEQQFSRIPVFEDTLDHLRGFIHVRDLYELDDAQRRTQTIEGLLRDLKPVPESKPVPDLLREMQDCGIHIVYVVNEYGRVAGLATMEDLVEEVFGEIRDEHEPNDDVERAADGAILVSGAFDLDHLEEHFGFRPQDHIESTTVGGLACEWYGAVPLVGESIEREGLRLDILAADDFRVDRVRISVAPAAEPESETP